MNPVGTSIQKSPQKKGYLASQPRWLRVSMWISSGILAILVSLRLCCGNRASHSGFSQLRAE